jgi:hypothetical protein
VPAGRDGNVPGDPGVRRGRALRRPRGRRRSCGQVPQQLDPHMSGRGRRCGGRPQGEVDARGGSARDAGGGDRLEQAGGTPAGPVGVDDVTERRQEARIGPGAQRCREAVDRRGQRHGLHDTLHRRNAAPARGPGCRRRGVGRCWSADRGARRRSGPSPWPPDHRSPPALHACVDPRDLVGPPSALGVLEVEQVVEGPVEVVGDVRDLLVQPVDRVRRYSPRRPPATSTAKSVPQEGQVTAARV